MRHGLVWFRRSLILDFRYGHRQCRSAGILGNELLRGGRLGGRFGRRLDLKPLR
jgi:hypothetical protein